MGAWQAGLAMLAALALHLGGFALVSGPTSGAQAAGNGGKAAITLAASDPVLAALVAGWDVAPVVTDAPPMPDAAPERVDAPVPAALPDAPPVMPDSMALTQPVLADRAPQMGAPPAPFVPDVRPKARPERQETAQAPPTKRQTGAGTVAQAAAGAGGGVAAGTAGRAAAGGLSDVAVAGLKAEWGSGIRAKIERKKRYPAGTTASGTVKLRLTVGADGRLQAVAVAGSSGDAALDNAAVKAVTSAGRFAKAPKGITGAANFTLNISFDR